MEQATTIGLDIAKHVFQVHGAPPGGAVLQLSRGDGVTNRIFDIDKFLVVATEPLDPVPIFVRCGHGHRSGLAATQ